jgi:hypothetical protein
MKSTLKKIFSLRTLVAVFMILAMIGFILSAFAPAVGAQEIDVPAVETVPQEVIEEVITEDSSVITTSTSTDTVSSENQTVTDEEVGSEANQEVTEEVVDSKEQELISPLSFFSEGFSESFSETDECTLVSDELTLYEGSPSVPVSYPFENWQAVGLALSGAQWMWSEDPIADATVETVKTFTRAFTLSADPAAALFEIAADDGFRIVVNGTLIVDKLEDGPLFSSVYSYDIASALVSGDNVIELTIKNFAEEGATAFVNPAGFIYKVSITEASCENVEIDYCSNLEGVQSSVPEGYESVGGECYEVWVAPYCGDGEVNQSFEDCDGGEECTAWCRSALECTEDVFASVLVTDIDNSGVGNATDNLFVGTDAESIPNGSWFPVVLGGAPLIDGDVSTFENVAGIAVARTMLGLQVRNYGHLPSGSKEHIEGYVAFSNVNALSQVNELAGDKMENPTDGIMTNNAGQDEMWIVDGVSYFHMTVASSDDGFITTYEEPLVCEDDNEPSATTVSVNKVVVGTEAFSVNDFTLYVDDEMVVREAFTDVATGTHTVSESGSPYFVPTFSGDCIADENNENVMNAIYDFLIKKQALQNAIDAQEGDDEDDALKLALIADIDVKVSALQRTIVAYIVAQEEQDAFCTITNTYTPLEGMTQCSDGIDNDDDGSVDSEDDECHTDGDAGDEDDSYDPFIDSEEDEDTTTTGTAGNRNRGQVLGASTQCSLLITEFMSYGANNSPDQVMRLQQFLNLELGLTLAITGEFDAPTFTAVKAFQLKYAEKVLAPWIGIAGSGISTIADATGIVYMTTAWMINEIICPDSNPYFPNLLTEATAP